MQDHEDDERVDLQKWRARRMLESSARKPRNKKRYTRKSKYKQHD